MCVVCPCSWPFDHLVRHFSRTSALWEHPGGGAVRDVYYRLQIIHRFTHSHIVCRENLFQKTCDNEENDDSGPTSILKPKPENDGASCKMKIIFQHPESRQCQSVSVAIVVVLVCPYVCVGVILTQTQCILWLIVSVWWGFILFTSAEVNSRLYQATDGSCCLWLRYF